MDFVREGDIRMLGIGAYLLRKYKDILWREPLSLKRSVQWLARHQKTWKPCCWDGFYMASVSVSHRRHRRRQSPLRTPVVSESYQHWRMSLVSNSGWQTLFSKGGGYPYVGIGANLLRGYKDILWREPVSLKKSVQKETCQTPENKEPCCCEGFYMASVSESYQHWRMSLWVTAVDRRCKGGGFSDVGMGANLLRGYKDVLWREPLSQKMSVQKVARHQKTRNLGAAMASLWLQSLLIISKSQCFLLFIFLTWANAALRSNRQILF